MVVLVMGVSGSGKTTVGELLASRLGCEFADADDYHPSANVEKMRAGIALTDADRSPWLDLLRDLIRDRLASGGDLVLACSALRAAYRDQLLAADPRVRVVYLKGDHDLIRRRLTARSGHYMNPQLLDSQLATLEEPADALAFDVALAPEAIVDRIEQRLGR